MSWFEIDKSYLQGKEPGQGLQSLLLPLRVGSTAPTTVSAQYRLQEIDLTGCWELDDVTVVRLLHSFPRLTSVKLGNIYSLTDATLRGIATYTRCVPTV